VPVVLLQVANFTSGVGNAIVMIALPWLVLVRTDSPAAAGLIAALSALPGLVMAPVAGWLVDHLGRRLVSVGSDILSALSVAAIPIVAAFTDLTYTWIVVLAVIGATFDPAGYTARRSLLPDVSAASGMPIERLNGIHEGVFAVGWTLGPLLGTALIATVGPETVFWAPFALFLVAAVCIAAMRVADAGQAARAERIEAGTEITGWAGIVRGFSVLWRDRLLRTVTIAVLVLAAIYLPTEAVVLPTHFEALGQPGSLGIVIAALAGGSAIGAFSYGWLSARMSRMAITRMVLIGTAASIIPMALLPPLPLMVIAAFFLGLCWGPFNPLMSTLVQRRVPADEQGRVYGVQLSVFYAAPPLAMLAVGLSVERFGVSATYLGLAGVLALTSLLVLLAPGLKEIDD
jgi:MFS family permease